MHVTVRQGDRIRGNASGIINFWGGTYPRNPDGKDEHGVTETATGGCPAPGRIRNSLVFRISGVVVQGGTNFDFACPASGGVDLTNNDDFAGDNNGSDGHSRSRSFLVRNRTSRRLHSWRRSTRTGISRRRRVASARRADQARSDLSTNTAGP